MVENGVESEIKFGVPTMRLCYWEYDRIISHYYVKTVMQNEFLKDFMNTESQIILT